MSGHATPMLLPCPWCGGSACVQKPYYPSFRVWQVSCEDQACEAMGPCKNTRREAANAWNIVAAKARGVA